MILYDTSLNMNFRDYGIILPILPDRGKLILEFMEKNYYPGTRGDSFPYPGPVLDIRDALVYLNIADRTVINRDDLIRIHSSDYIASLYDKKGLETALHTSFELIDSQGRLNRYEPDTAKKPLSELFQIILAQAGGTWLACRLALAPGPGFCYYLGGGMHHARYDSGSGFCLINDVAIAAAKMCAKTAFSCGSSNNIPRLIWIIDLDVHMGDGTAELIHFSRQRGELYDPHIPMENDDIKPCILTLSIHMAHGWPLDSENLAAAEKGRAPLLASDVDIGIDAGQENEYTPRLIQGIKELEQLSAALYPIPAKPDLVLVVDGADPYEYDELPSASLLKLSLEQCLERDNYVYRYLMDRSIPSAWILSGGYGERAWEPPAYFLQGIR